MTVTLSALPELRREGRQRRATVPALILLAGALVVALPALGLSPYLQSLLYLIFFWTALATSWSLFSGNTGYFSFGHGAFYGVGAYAAANLAQAGPAGFGLSVAAGGLAAAALAVGVGAIVFRVRRLRGEVFALLTLALAFVVSGVVLNTPLDGGAGVFLSGASVPAILGSTSTTLYLAQGAVASLALFTACAIQKSRFGRGLLAISDAENVAEIYGVPTYRYKLAAFAISAAIAGLAGGVHAFFIGYLTVSETFSVTVPLLVLLMGVLGGARHWMGAALGAALIATLNTTFVGGEYALLARAAIGGTLVLAMLFLPEGIMGRFGRGARREAPRPEAPAAATDERRGFDPGPAVLDGAAAQARRAGDVLLSCRGVSLSFRGLKALDGVDLDVREGEILGLVGPNGSGKSTLINSISGFYRPQAGQITFRGENLIGASGHRIAGLGVARTFQIPQPFARLSVLDNVRLARAFGRSGRAPGDDADARRWLGFVGLADRADALPGELNLHQRKFLELARALATGARLIMLDEVLAGMTPSEIEDAIALVRRIRDSGATVLFVEHNIRAVLALSDRLAVLEQGRVIALGSPREVMADPKVVAAYLGAGHA